MSIGERFLKSMSLKRTNAENRVIITPPDKTLIIVSIFILVIGIMSVFSAGSARAIREGLNPAYYLIRQFAGLVIGGICCYFATFKLDYKKLQSFTVPFALFVLVLLILTASPLGISANGAQRWLAIGSIRFQPSEFAKLAVVLCFAKVFSKDVRIIDPNKYLYYGIFLISIFLILKQPNLSMVILLLSTTLSIYFCAGGSIRTIVTGIVAAIPVLSIYIVGYQIRRIRMWIDPEIDPKGAGYNIIQSLIAFAEGGLTGVGYGNSKQKLSWLPEGHTDFIFSIIAEEFGFVGCIFLIVLFMIFIRRGFMIASRCPDKFGKLLAFGITFSIGFQALINMAVASSFLPATGIPMPFVSFGSSSLVITMFMLGILLNISRKKVQRITPLEVVNA